MNKEELLKTIEIYLATACTSDMQEFRNSVWQLLENALHDKSCSLMAAKDGVCKALAEIEAFKL